MNTTEADRLEKRLEGLESKLDALLTEASAGRVDAERRLGRIDSRLSVIERSDRAREDAWAEFRAGLFGPLAARVLQNEESLKLVDPDACEQERTDLRKRLRVLEDKGKHREGLTTAAKALVVILQLPGAGALLWLLARLFGADPISPPPGSGGTP